MRRKQVLIALIEEHNWDDLPEYIRKTGQGSGKDQSQLKENLSELSNSEQNLVWNCAVSYFLNYAGKYLINDNAHFCGNKPIQEKAEIENQDKDDLNVQSIFVLATHHINVLIVEKNHPLHLPEKLTQFIVLIGSLLSQLRDPIHGLATKLCEQWISADLERSDEIVSNTLLAVINICLRPKAKKQDAKRAWHLRKGLDNLALEIDSENCAMAETLITTLVSCATSLTFLQCEEGAKFLSLVFGIPSLVSPFHLAVKKYLPTATKSQCEMYADIYFRTWRNSNEDLKMTFQQNCLQDLMHLAVHADPYCSHLSSNLTVFLHHIHKHKKHLPTASMIYSLYEPFIWRSVKVANGYVRSNAVTLLCDVFPCTDISLSHEEKSSLMERQYQTFLTLLVDPCHHVRIATIKGVFSILTNFWLLIPANIIQSMFQIFLKKLIVDVSSAEIRKLVVQGMSTLLDCADASPFMNSILPNISSSFDDVNSSVRIQFLKLLIKVKKSRFIKYWKLVPMEHLVNRLAEDNSCVRALITELIYSSFLPIHLDEKEILMRCISLIQINRAGARRFYQHASKKLDVETTTRIILYVWRTLYRFSLQSSLPIEDENDSSANVSSSVSLSPKKQRSATNQFQNKENKAPESCVTTDESPKSNSGDKDETDDSSAMPLDNPNVVGGLLDIIIINWTMNAPRLGLPENVKYLDALRNRISRAFPIVWSFFKEDVDIAKSLLYLSSFLPKSHVPTMVGLCLSHLKAIEVKKEMDNSYVMYINALCNWNRIDDVIELILEWVEAAFNSTSSSEHNAVKKGKGVRFKEKGSPKPRLALLFLNHILSHPLNKMVLLQSKRNLLLQLWDQMAQVQVLLEERLIKETELSSICCDSFLCECWRDFLCVTTLLNVDPRAPSDGKEEIKRGTRIDVYTSPDVTTFNSLSHFKEYLKWISEFVKKTDEDRGFDSALFLSCATHFLKAGMNLIAIGVADDAFMSDYLMFVSLILNQVCFDVDLWCSILRGISQVHNYWNAYGQDNHHHDSARSSIHHSCSLVISALKDKRESVLLCDKEKLEKLSESLSLTLLNLSQDSGFQLTSLMNVLISSLLESIADHDDQIKTKSELTRIKHLPGEAFVLLSTVCRSTKLTCIFIQTFIDEITKLKHIQMVWAAVYLLTLLRTDKGKLSLDHFKRAVHAASEVIDSVNLPETPSEHELQMTPVKKNFEAYENTKTMLEKLKNDKY